ncbi:MAG: hypothetical protein U0892_01160 [Pirellulales bacterium]
MTAMFAIKFEKLRAGWTVVFLVACAAILPTPTLHAQSTGNSEPSDRLTAPQLFPEKTLAYVRIGNVKELKEALDRSSIGKLSKDDKIRPILAEFYGSLVNSTDAMRDAIGMNLDELLSIPSGEVALAILPSDQMQANVRSRRQDNEQTEVRVEVSQPSVAVLLDAGDEIAGLQVLLRRMDENISQVMEHKEVKYGKLILHHYQNPDRADQRFGYFIDKGTMVACSDLIGLERLAKRWSGEKVDWPSLAENRRFTSIMGRCVGTQGERPQLSFYADPLAFARNVSPPSAGSTMVFAMLPALGIDGIEAVGGSWIVAPPDFDSIMHFHVLLGTPRRAILALLRPKSGSTVPEDWVPDTVGSYSTINWDVASTLQAIEQLFNEFRGPDAFDKEVLDRISETLKLDFRKDILESIDGRFTLAQGFVRPVTINSGSNVYGVKLRNPEYFRKTVMPKLIEFANSRGREIKTETFGKWQVQVFEPEGRFPEGSTLRRPEICATVIDDTFVIADSRFMMRELAECSVDADKRLSQALDFQLISDRIKAQLQGKDCSALSYQRPEESLLMFYELARDPGNRDRLRQMSDNNPFFTALLAALDNHKLPDFAVIAKYLAPSGGFLVEEETGLHYMTFGLRRE